MEIPNFIKALLPWEFKTTNRPVRIALDESVGQAKYIQLKNMGYEVVCIAKHAEMDVDWLNRAFTNGALFVVSPDLDIPNLIEKENYPMIWIDYLHVPKEKNGGKSWAQYVDQRIKAKLAFFKNQFGDSPTTRVRKFSHRREVK